MGTGRGEDGWDGQGGAALDNSSRHHMDCSAERGTHWVGGMTCNAMQAQGPAAQLTTPVAAWQASLQAACYVVCSHLAHAAQAHVAPCSPRSPMQPTLPTLSSSSSCPNPMLTLHLPPPFLPPAHPQA